MKLISRQAFTLVELMVTVAVVGIVSTIVIRSTFTFLQEQKLRQAANELVSYLLTARAKALREASAPEKACEVMLDDSESSTTRVWTVSPTTDQPNQPANVCNDTPSLPTLNLLTASGGSNLEITSNVTNEEPPFFITFTRMGTVASSNLSSTALVSLPRIFYLSNTSATHQRCVMVDLNSLRIGWRNSQSGPCSYNGN
jgi:prepilin-type N-terminal cleavage/methylation domain-containing protein